MNYTRKYNHSIIYKINKFKTTIILHNYLCKINIRLYYMADKFLEDFRASIDKLNGLKTRLEQKSAEKTQFNATLVKSLKDVKDKIAALADQINQFKLMVDGLQGQVNNNAANVKAKEDEIARATQQVAGLEEQKKQLTDQLAQAQQQLAQQGQEAQQKINDHEAQLRDLTAKNAEIQKQLDAVNAELAGKNDLQAQQAEAARQQLENQAKANQEQQEKLTARINELEANLQDIQKQLQDKTAEAAAQVDTINRKEQEGQAQIAGLTAQMTALQAKNEDLINRIAEATGVINATVEKLEELMLNEPNPNDIAKEFEEIELAIGNIARVIQGQAPVQQGLGPPQPAQQAALSGDTPITIDGTTKSLGAIIKQLNDKIANLTRRGYSGDKYKEALDALRTARTVEDVVRIISPSVYKNGNVFGGKRTKKNRRKQKGGFIYKQKSKRRSISSSTRRKRSSKSSNF
jgi:myosin heavy subunit